MNLDKEARELATKREQLIREQAVGLVIDAKS